jgi:fructose-bisphosphate aldolase / 2-amino-3,7-dideoxy-D-threo-hept-6-ulosonate synthase
MVEPVHPASATTRATLACSPGPAWDGRQIRLRRLFSAASGTSIIVPMDQAIEGDFPELERPARLVSDLADAGANGFLMRRGLARYTAGAFAGRAAWIGRLTARSALSGAETDQLLVASPEEMLHAGADAVVFTLFVGPGEERHLPEFGRVADACHRLGLPLMAEPFPVGDDRAVPYEGPYSVAEMRNAVRIACEEGADIVKTSYTGDSASFARVIAYATVPVVIAGGARASGDVSVLEAAKGAMDAGASGTVIGRRVWQSPDPAALLHAMSEIVHEGHDVDRALQAMREWSGGVA